MLRPAAVILVLAGLIGFGAMALEPVAGPNEASGSRAIVVRGHDSDVLVRLPLRGNRFAVSYRNSIYGTRAEERYVVLPDGRYRLVQLAADQLAVLEEYYAVATPPSRADAADRREWVVPPDPERSPVFEQLSIAATDLGQRTVHVRGSQPLALWQLVDDQHPFVVLGVEANP